MKLLLLLCLFSFILQFSNGSRILCYLSSTFKSHVIVALPVCEELAARGHNVLTVTHFKFGKETSNFTNIVVDVPGFSDEVKKMMASGKESFSYKFLNVTSNEYRRFSLDMLRSKEMEKIMNTEKFDLVIFMSALFNNVHLGLADHFKAPSVIISPVANIVYNRRFVGAPSLPATVPYQIFSISEVMNFKERFLNFLFNISDYLLDMWIDYLMTVDYESVFPSDKYRSYQEMKNNVSLLLINTHFSDTGIIRPLLPNEIEIAGIQIKTKPAPLTSELKTFLDEAKDGVILWTFGSYVNISSTQPEKVDTMLKVLSKLQQRVIMKWEIDEKSRLPKNVLGQKWLPQESILAHPNVKLFISHCGAGGSGEAKYHQVPILGMPFFGDQSSNIATIEKDGWGRSIKLFDLTEENFSEILNDMLTNQK